MDSISKFSVESLWPDLGALIEAIEIFRNTGVIDINTLNSDVFSALVWAILVLIFSVNFIWAFRNACRAFFTVSFYNRLLKKQSRDTLFDDRQSLRERADKKPKYGKLWGEFDESLVENARLRTVRNTIDADHFFNSRTLAKGIANSRFFTAVPSFLTATGVLGTFAGLQMGLSGFEASSTEAMKNSIFTMISGASVAFLTSVWGVGLSLLFNLYEKTLETHVTKRIAKLQNRIDYLFPRITPEEVLVDIESSSQASKETLNGLAEKISDRMQENLMQMSNNINDGIRDALNGIMAPALESLTTGANDRSERALKEIVNTFTDKIGDAGKEQADALHKAATHMEDSFSAAGNHITGLVDNLNEQNKQFHQHTIDQQNLYEEHVKSLSETQEKQSKAVTDNILQIIESSSARLHKDLSSITTEIRNELNKNIELQQVEREKASQDLSTIIRGVGQNVAKQLKDQSEASKNTSDTINKTLTDVQDTQKDILDNVSEQFGTYANQMSEITNQIDLLITGFSSALSANQGIVNTLDQTTTNLRDASSQLMLLGTSVKNASEELSGSIQSAVDETGKLVESTTSVNNELSQTATSIVTASDSVKQSSLIFGEAAEVATDGLKAVKNHFEDLGESLGDHIDSVETQVAKLLREYADNVSTQVNVRMNEWNKQTSQFSDSMVKAVSSINDIVDEIETKVGA